MPDIIGRMFQIISGTSKTVSGTQNLERNVPYTAHKNVPDISLLLGTLFLLVFPVNATKDVGLTIEVDKVVREVRISAPGVIVKELQ
jgi:hypothetical protein